MELFEEIRREHAHGAGTIRAVAKKLGVHRRMVRQALASSIPPERKLAARNSKQRHTAHRIWERIRQERSDTVAEATVRRYVREGKQKLGLTGRETFVPQVYDWGGEAQVDWYEAMADFAGERLRVYIFAIRSMASGGAFHVAYYHATQQAFLEAHELAFNYFGGVFRCLRYDNLKSAVKKILRGHQREETERLIAFRSHWGFQTEFCNPARGNEKGGVEGEVGYFRRNHLVPQRFFMDQKIAWASAHIGVTSVGCNDRVRNLIGETCKLDNRRVLQPGRHPIPQKSEGRKSSAGKPTTSITVRGAAVFWSGFWSIKSVSRENSLYPNCTHHSAMPPFLPFSPL